MIHFVEAGTSISGLTKVWSVKALTGMTLGQVSWYEPWRKYCFFPLDRTVFDSSCLHKIIDFCEDRTEEHRECL